MVTLNLTEEQFILLRSAVDIHLEQTLENLGFYLSPDHFDQEEVNAFRQERDDLFSLIDYLKEFDNNITPYLMPRNPMKNLIPTINPTKGN